jgi:hypothetical protein
MNERQQTEKTAQTGQPFCFVDPDNTRQEAEVENKRMTLLHIQFYLIAEVANT